MKHALIGAVLAMVVASSNAMAAGSEIEALKAQMKTMMERIEQLEKAEAATNRASQSAHQSSKQEIERRATTSEPRQEKAKSSVSTTKAANSSNPAISVVGTFTGQRIRGSGGVQSSSFLPLSEAEFIFGANIDPHARLDVTVTGANGGMAVEEGYITAYLPLGVNLKAGRKFLPIGRVNGVHPHSLIYGDRPNGLVNLFGPEIFVGDGLLIDRPFFIGDSAQTVTAGLFSTTNDVAFDPTGANQYAGLARWTGVWDSSDFSTLELGATYVQGKNGIAAASGSQTRLMAGHLAWKYADLEQLSLGVEGEWIHSRQEQGLNVAPLNSDGSYLLADLGINRNWHLFSRFDYSRQRDPVTQMMAIEKGLSAGVVRKLSEFQSLTFQYKHTRGALANVAADMGIAPGGRANAWYFRWVVAIGPHGAHAY